MELARYVVAGRTPEEWFPGYGQSLYDSVRAFAAPLVFLFRVFGSTRLVGQLFSVVVGVGVATLTTALGLRFLRPAYAVLAGTLVALLPSEILFSSVVLREAHIWLALVFTALGAAVMAGPSARRVAVGLLVGIGGLLALAYLRDQTFLAAAWSFGLAGLAGARRWWPLRASVAVAVAVLVPAAVGLGMAGRDLVTQAGPHLAATRSVLAEGASTAFVKPAKPAKRGDATAGAPGIAARAAVTDNDSGAISFRHLPVGLVDVVLRPFPWQSQSGITLLFARVENLAWYLLYLLAIIGAAVSARRREARRALLFPFLVVCMILGIAALTEGNLGTAFRHRNQVLWGLALFAAAGVQWLVPRRRADNHLRGETPRSSNEDFALPEPTPFSSSASRGAQTL